DCSKLVEVVVESKRHLNAELFHHDFARAVGEAPTLVVELLKCLPFGLSLCNLCVLCVSVVWFYSEFINHRDTEDTEVAQRRARWRLFVQTLRLGPTGQDYFPLENSNCKTYRRKGHHDDDDGALEGDQRTQHQQARQ